MLTVERILWLFAALNDELAKRGIRGEAYLAGGDQRGLWASLD